MLLPVPATAIDRSLSPVVQITSVEKIVTSVRPNRNVQRASSAVKVNASVFGLLAPVRTTPNVTVVSNAVTENASVVRLLFLVRKSTSVALERIVVGKCVCRTGVGAAELLQAL